MSDKPARTEQEIYEKAKQKWGFEGQRVVLMEECAELIAAMAQFINGKRLQEAVIEEIADVEIMCAQMRLYFNPHMIESIKQGKIKRLESVLFKE